MNNQAPGLGQHVIMGGFNFHMDVDAGSSTHFRELLEIHGLQQHVTESTHVRGHILYLVITHIDADSISELLIDDTGVSDHSAVFFKLRGHKPAPPPKEFTYRAYRKINIDSLKQDIAYSSLCTKPSEDLDGLVSQYNTVLTDLMDKYAPAKQKTIILRPNTDWHTDEIVQLSNAIF